MTAAIPCACGAWLTAHWELFAHQACVAPAPRVQEQLTPQDNVQLMARDVRRLVTLAKAQGVPWYQQRRR